MYTDEKDGYGIGQSRTARRLGNKKGMRTVLIFRHGRTPLNGTDQLRGWLDVDLTEEGRWEAAEVARKVSRDPPDILFSSDLRRAIDTARIIAAYNNIKLEVPCADFRPWNIGNLAGQDAAKAAPILAEYVDKPKDPVPGGESFNSFRGRFLEGLAKALNRHSGTIGIVTHHRVERFMKAWAKAGYMPDGTIDKAEFKKKGEPTGHCEVMSVPLKRLKAFAHDKVPSFGDGQEEAWLDWVRTNR